VHFFQAQKKFTMGDGMFQLTRRLVVTLLLGLAASFAHAQDFSFPAAAATDDMELAKAVPVLARQVLAVYRDGNVAEQLRLRVAAEQFAEAVAEFEKKPSGAGRLGTTEIQLYARTRALEETRKLTFEDAFRTVFRETFAAYDDRAAADIAYLLETPSFVYQRQLQPLRDKQKGRTTLSLADALQLIRAYVSYEASRYCAPLIGALDSCCRPAGSRRFRSITPCW
jgi:hypothetical protein